MLTTYKFDRKLSLIESDQDLTDVANFIRSLDRPDIGLDTETTGLDYVRDKIVGIGFSVHSRGVKEGFYIPLRHRIFHYNCEIQRAIKFVTWLYRRYKIFLFNRDFDHFMLEADGFVVPEGSNTHDVQIMVWEAFSEPFPSLKVSVKKFLKIEMPTFTETVRGSFNFGMTDPSKTFTYAALDPLVTVELGQYCWTRFKHIHKIYPLDNKATEVIRNSTKQHIAVDYDEVRKQFELNELKMREVQQQIYNIVGYPFSLNSAKEKIQALSRFVTLTARTPKGAISVKAEHLDKIDHPLAKLLVRFAELQTFNSSYTSKLLATEGKSTRMQYSCVNVPTGRLSSGGSKYNSYFMDMNIQSTPKTEEVLYLHKCNTLGLRLTTERDGALGEMETKSGFRRCYNAPEGYAFLSFDYSAQEYRIATNYSREKVWADAFNAGKDFHMETAKLAFGVESKEARGHAKSINFGTLYGMSVYSLSDRLGISVPEAQSIYDKVLGGLPNLNRWINHQKSQARKRGMTFTYYGRPRNLQKYYDTSDPSKVAFADRSSVNTVVQGAGGDILRKKFCEVDYLLKKNQSFADNVKIAFSCYDELNFYVKFSYVSEAYKIIKDLMYEMHDDWLVPLIVEGSVGHNWGDQIANPIFQDGKVVGAEKGIKWY